ncbi:hypothetical protein ILYODFUR_031804 [Ilyodon furcidens]|uniref:Uncharacterized protein n=1 Tax=Ilyodon furcidens TaxID=33524 RepID=A0ABV0UY32_9TELE
MTKFYTVAEALDLITMDCVTEVCAEDSSSEDKELLYSDMINDELGYVVLLLERKLQGGILTRRSDQHREEYHASPHTLPASHDTDRKHLQALTLNNKHSLCKNWTL